jgi:hypothetical protein
MRSQTIPAPVIRAELKKMVLKGTSLLRSEVQAFLAEDTELAIIITKDDAENDLLHERTFDKLIKFVFTEPRNIQRLTNYSG